MNKKHTLNLNKPIQFFVMICLFMPINIFAQQKKRVKKLENVLIIKKPIEVFLQGNNTTKIDKLDLLQNLNSSLAVTLMEKSSLQIRNSLPGMLATISSRGSSPGHVAVMWNGLNISAVTNGLTDASMLPNVAFDDVQIVQNGFSTAAGVGAMGACIILGNDKPVQNDFQMGLGLASYSKRNLFLKSSFVKNKYSSNILVNYLQSENDFSFINTSKQGMPIQKMKHARYNQKNIFVNSYYTLNDKTQFSLHAWTQQNERLLPATLTQDTSASTQTDASFKINLQFRKQFSKVMFLEVQSAYLYDNLNFKDSLIDINSTYKTSQIINSVSFHAMGQDTLASWQVGLSNNYTEAKAIELDGQKWQNKLALFTNFSKQSISNKHKLSISGRQEFITPKLLPISASLGYELKCSNHYLLLTNISRNYRVPTFNDLFWYQGGNKNLLPEKSFNVEISLQNKWNSKKISTTNILTIFNKNISDWIQWTPVNAVWHPINLLKVWSRGLEVMSNVSWQINSNKRANLKTIYSFTKCTNQAVAANSINSLHKQLMYVPLHKLVVNIRYALANTSVFSNLLLEGSQFTTTDNYGSLPAYFTQNIGLMQTIKINNMQVYCSANVNNIYNTNYQQIAYNPNPRRNYAINITIKQQLKNQKTNTNQ
jgi:vitamin B12 transporter